jgi:hypothetical protein
MVLHASRASADGEHAFKVRVVNQLNPGLGATDVDVAFNVVSSRYLLRMASGEALETLKLPDVQVVQGRAVNSWFQVVNPSAKHVCQLKFRVEDRPDLLAQLSLVQRGSGALVSGLELSPGERVDLRVVLQTKPGCVRAVGAGAGEADARRRRRRGQLPGPRGRRGVGHAGD